MLGWVQGTPLPLPYLAIFWECWFFDKRSEEKSHVELGSLGGGGVWGGAVSPPQWGQGEEPCKIYAILHSEYLKTERAHCGNSASMVICLFLDELIFTLLRAWGSAFGIANWYINFKTLDTILSSNCYIKALKNQTKICIDGMQVKMESF